MIRDAENKELPFISSIIEFPDDKTAFQLCKPLTDYRACHYGTPSEARVVFTCRKVGLDHHQQQQQDQNKNQNQAHGDGHDDDNFIIKIKVQIPMPNSENPAAGPSTTTEAEVAALRRFTEAKNPHVPHLVCYQNARQPETTEKSDESSSSTPLPGGFVSYIVMNKLPGNALHAQYWSASHYSQEQRQEICDHFLEALQSVRALGIEPTDRGLRNVLWAADIKHCSIVDFELYDDYDPSTPAPSPVVKDSLLQKWGLSRAVAATNWFQEWFRLAE